MKKESIILVLLAFITLFSCKKSDVGIQQPIATAQRNIQEISVSEGKKYFDALYQTDINTKSNGEPLSIIPQWEKSFSAKNRKYQFIEVPVSNKKKRVVILKDRESSRNPQEQLKSAFQTFAIYRDSLNNLQYRLITYVGSEDYLRKRNYDISHNRLGKIDQEFEGYINYSNQFGVSLFTLKVRNGIPYTKVTAYGTQERIQPETNRIQLSTLAPSTTGARLMCQEICAENWVQYCTQVTSTYWDDALGKEVTYESGEVCEYVLESIDCHDVCIEVDDEEEPAPCYDTTDPTGECYDPNNPNGGDGSGSTFTPTPSEIAWPGDIKCTSFRFISFGESSSAAVKLSKNPSFGDIRTGKYREFPIRTIIIDVPKNIKNPEPQYISPGYAADKCAKALNTTVKSLGATYGQSGAWQTISSSTFENNLLLTFLALLQTDIPGARVSFESANTYTTRPGLTPTNSEHDGLFDGIFGGSCQ